MQTSLGLGENIFDNVAVLQKKQTAVTFTDFTAFPLY